MKYKYKPTGEMISKELFNQPIWEQDSFEPVYEVGDWAYASDTNKTYLITERYNSLSHTISIDFVNENKDAFRPATEEEIRRATKRFPFEYETNVYKFEIKDDTHPNQVRITDKGNSDEVFLTKEAWQKIGELKGWFSEGGTK